MGQSPLRRIRQALIDRKRRRNRLKINRKSSTSGSLGRGLSFRIQRERDKTKTIKNIALWIGEIVFVIALAAVVVFYLGMQVRVVGNSMAPTLENGDVVWVNRFAYLFLEPKANDLVVFLPDGNEDSYYRVLRVIAVPGDTVQIIDGVVYVNGEAFPEKIDVELIDEALLAEEPIVVGQDEYFVLGDNRNNSEDSRYVSIGNVDLEDLIGRAWFLGTSWKRFGFLK